MTRRPIPKAARWVIVALLGGALTGILAKAFYSVVVIHGVETELRACAVWGALLLASFTGWGSGLNNLVHPRARADWGLRCAWGWGVVVTIGGVLCAAEWARSFVLVRLVAVGLCLFLADTAFELVRWARRGVSWRGRLHCADWRFHAAAVPVYLLALIQAAGCIQQSDFNPNDDLIAYFQFAREIVERGTFTQPFSLRHISAFGGKSFLDALALSIDIRETHLHMVDKSLGLLTVLGLLTGQARASRRTSRPILLLLMGFLVVLPSAAINSTTMLTGVVFYLGIYRTLKWPPVTAHRGLRASLPVAILRPARVRSARTTCPSGGGDDPRLRRAHPREPARPAVRVVARGGQGCGADRAHPLRLPRAVVRPHLPLVRHVPLPAPHGQLRPRVLLLPEADGERVGALHLAERRLLPTDQGAAVLPARGRDDARHDLSKAIPRPRHRRNPGLRIAALRLPERHDRGSGPVLFRLHCRRHPCDRARRRRAREQARSAWEAGDEPRGERRVGRARDGSPALRRARQHHERLQRLPRPHLEQPSRLDAVVARPWLLDPSGQYPGWGAHRRDGR